ncbi:MAG TPA: hypothetical protein VF953_12710, partial [Terriglobales bacterium]
DKASAILWGSLSDMRAAVDMLRSQTDAGILRSLHRRFALRHGGELIICVEGGKRTVTTVMRGWREMGARRYGKGADVSGGRTC